MKFTKYFIFLFKRSFACHRLKINCGLPYTRFTKLNSMISGKFNLNIKGIYYYKSNSLIIIMLYLYCMKTFKDDLFLMRTVF